MMNISRRFFFYFFANSISTRRFNSNESSSRSQTQRIPKNSYWLVDHLHFQKAIQPTDMSFSEILAFGCGNRFRWAVRDESQWNWLNNNGHDELKNKNDIALWQFLKYFVGLYDYMYCNFYAQITVIRKPRQF